jgi:hypothetical protein
LGILKVEDPMVEFGLDYLPFIIMQITGNKTPISTLCCCCLSQGKKKGRQSLAINKRDSNGDPDVFIPKVEAVVDAVGKGREGLGRGQLRLLLRAGPIDGTRYSLSR